jgi:tetratricopeptide (TPR) repeat protein
LLCFVLGIMVRRTSSIFSLALLVCLGLATSCKHHDELARAAALERDGHAEAALSVYRQQLAKATEQREKSQLQVHIGECLLKLSRPSDAFAAFQRAVDLDDENTAAHLKLGQLYLASGDADHATVHAQALLHGGSLSLEALTLMGSAAAAAGHTHEAEQTFRRVLELQPGRIPVAVALAEVYLASGNPEEARKLLKDTAKSQPQSAYPLLALGRLEEEQGNQPAAESAYRSAVAAENTPETNLRLAQFLERGANLEEVQKVLATVDQMRPSLPIARADFDMTSGRPQAAAEAYLKNLNPHLGPAPALSQQPEGDRAQLAARLIESELAQASAGNLELLPERPEQPTAAQTQLGLARLHLKDFDDAFDEATKKVLQAEIYLVDANPTKALNEAQDAVKLAPGSASAHYVLGRVRQAMGSTDAAVQEYEAALTQDSDYLPAHLALAENALAHGKVKEAHTHTALVVRAEPANLAALELFARTLATEREYASAELILLRLQRLDPNSAVPALVRGDIAFAQSQAGHALIYYQQALAHDPRSSAAMERLVRVYRQGTITRAMLTRMESIASTPPVSPALLELAGRLFADRGWAGDASRCLRKAIAMDPERGSAARFLASVELRNGDAKSAASAAAHEPHLSPLLSGWQAQRADDLPAAVGSYEAAVRAGDPSGVACNNLAWIYAMRGQKLDKALSLAQRARLAQPENAAVADTLGYVHLARHEYTEAIRVLESAQRLAKGKNPETLAEVQRHLKQAYLRAGLPEQAKTITKSVAGN